MKLTNNLNVFEIKEMPNILVQKYKVTSRFKHQFSKVSFNTFNSLLSYVKVLFVYLNCIV